MVERENTPFTPAAGVGLAIDTSFVDIAARCPYGLEQIAVYHQAIFGWMDEVMMGRFLSLGYRRNGNTLYNMRCPQCSLCVPIRIRPERFQPDRNQRRVLKKNRDVTAGVAPLTMSRENLNLLEKFLVTRYPDSNNHAEGYYTGFFITSITRCFEIRYRVDDQLVGVAVVDAAAGWLNAVYYYFDPELADRSLGTYNILYLVNFCRYQKIPYLYLGYWIKDLKGMDYKKRFRPHELLIDGAWIEMT